MLIEVGGFLSGFLRFGFCLILVFERRRQRKEKVVVVYWFNGVYV